MELLEFFAYDQWDLLQKDLQTLILLKIVLQVSSSIMQAITNQGLEDFTNLVSKLSQWIVTK
jgi:hypothetical protein